MSHDSEQKSSAALQRALVAIKDLRTRLESMEQAQNEPIAIIGMGCRFPGSGENVDAYWRMLLDGEDAICEIPRERWDAEALYDPDPATPGKMSTRWGGFLKRPVAQFDAGFFGIGKREADHMDPQQRVLLEVTWETLQMAGVPQETLRGSKTGVFVGAASLCDEYWQHLSHPSYVSSFSAIGTSHSVLAGRISYLLDLHGPSVALDTACSSSLVAVHLACQNLRERRCDLALAGGVGLLLAPYVTIGMSKMGLMAADGRCKSFDSRANGYVRGEGCGVVMLKRASEALADGDPIFALVRGSAVNQDGRTNGLSAPNGLAQQAVIREALAKAGVAPEDIGYVEGHATGTSLGDPIEIEALSEVLGRAGDGSYPCTLGAVKTNLGHLEGAAGVAGLIKATMVLKTGRIPKNLHFEKLNPHISLEGTRLRLATEPTEWRPEGRRRYAGVSAFGWSGTNAHIVLEQPDPAPERAAEEPARPELVVLSAKSPEALRDLAQSWRDGVSEESVGSLLDLAYTAAERRSHYPHRLGLVALDLLEVNEKLGAYLAGERRAGMALGEASPRSRGPVMVFSGQGTQWLGMGRELAAREPVFAGWLAKIDAELAKHSGWSLLAELEAEEASSRLGETEVAQPVILAYQVALAELWRSWGIEPSAVVGHSVGEIAACYVSGVLSLEEVVRVAYHRGRLMQRATGLGRMAAVDLTEKEARELVAGHEKEVAIGAVNGPSQTVLSGEVPTLEAILAELDRRRVRNRWLPVNYAFHSPQMDAIRDELVSSLAGLAGKAARIPLYSTVTAGVLDGASLGAGYWFDNVRQAVRFAPTVMAMVRDGHDAFLEVGSHSVLAASVSDCAELEGKKAVVVPAPRKDHPEAVGVLQGLAQLYTAGFALDFAKVLPAGGRACQLPLYPWQRQSFWVDLPADAQPFNLQPKAGAQQGHPLLGAATELASPAGTFVWEVTLAGPEAAFLLDHRVQGVAVFPAAGYLDLALAAATERFGAGEHEVVASHFEQVLLLEGPPRQVQLVLSSELADVATFKIASRPAGASEGWVQHASGTLRVAKAAGRGEAGESPAEAAPGASLTQAKALDAPAHYRQMVARGLEYGPAFQGVAGLEVGQGDVSAELVLPAPLAGAEPRFALHPSLLDSAFQAVAACLGGGEEATTVYLPVKVQSLKVLGRFAGGRVEARLAERQQREGRKRVSADLWLFDAEGRPVVEVKGFELAQLDGGVGGGLADPLASWLWRHDWQEKPLGEVKASGGRFLLLADRRGVADALAAELEARGAEVVEALWGTEFHQLGERRYEVSAGVEGLRALVESLTAGGQAPLSGVLHAWALERSGAGSEAPREGWSAGSRELALSVIDLVKALDSAKPAPRLWLVTAGARRVAAAGDAGLDPAQATLAGLGRVLALEEAELAPRRVDLSAKPSDVELKTLALSILAEDGEDELALRGASRYASRLRQAAEGDFAAAEAAPAIPVTAGKDAFRLEVASPGILDSLTYRLCERSAPGPGEVEIEIHAAALNFSDVMKAMGTYPGLPAGTVPVGIECSGVVRAVGEEVSRFAPGDSVLAFAPFSFASFVRVPEPMVAAKPASLSFEEAATLPIAYLTAYYALNDLGRMAAGDRVLIHSASGGVGLAAIQLARQAGAEIYATAGSEEKRKYLRNLGIRHVYDSRTVDFAEAIHDATSGAGVDLILNSLPGEAIAKGLALLAPGGRFLEIGKRDIYGDSRIGLLPFQNNLSFFAIDLDRLSRRTPEVFRALFDGLMPGFERGELAPLAHEVFPLGEVKKAFRHMAQARHIGKIVLGIGGESTLAAPAPARHGELSAEASYLLTGGLGGLGLAVAGHLVERGARRLILLGRSAPSPAAEARLAELRAQGAEVVVAQADVASAAQLEALFSGARSQGHPVRGIVHAAGVIDDALARDQSAERFAKVFPPKVDGALHLTELARREGVDFLVFFSSVAAMLGSPGQGNYAAANSFLDALAEREALAGLPVLSISWGPWAEVGMAARGDQGERLAARGLPPIVPAEGLAALDRLLAAGARGHAGLIPFAPELWCQFYPSLSLWSELAAAGESAQAARGGASLRERLAAMASPAKRWSELLGHVLAQVAQVLGLAPEKIDREAPLASLGMESLQTTELRNSLQVSLGVSLPSTLIWRYPTAAAIAGHLAEQLGFAAPSAAAEEALAPAPVEEVASDDELADLLSQEVAALNQMTE